MRRLLFLLALLLPLEALAIPVCRVAQLAACASDGERPGSEALVNDGASSSDCTTGGGTNVVRCTRLITGWSQISGGGGGGPASFDQITTGTNSSATMTVNTGASILRTGTGVVGDYLGARQIGVDLPPCDAGNDGKQAFVTNGLAQGICNTLTGSAKTVCVCKDSIWTAVLASGPPLSSVEILDGTIQNADLANMAANTIKGNNTGGAATPANLTATQVTAMLNTFTTNLKGLVPDPGGTPGTTDFLRRDGAWAVPPGGGGFDPTSYGTTTWGSGSDFDWTFNGANATEDPKLRVVDDRFVMRGGVTSQVPLELTSTSTTSCIGLSGDTAGDGNYTLQCATPSGGTIVDWSSANGAGSVNGVTSPLQIDFDANSNKIVNLTDGAANGDAVNLGQLNAGLALKANSADVLPSSSVLRTDAANSTTVNCAASTEDGRVCISTRGAMTVGNGLWAQVVGGSANGFERMQYNGDLNSNSGSHTAVDGLKLTSITTTATWATQAATSTAPVGFTRFTTAAGTGDGVQIGTDASSYATWLLGYGQVVFDARVKLGQLSDGTDTFVFWCGLIDAVHTGTANRGIAIYYTDTGATPNWKMWKKEGTGPTTTDLTGGTAVDTNWHRVSVVVNKTGTSVGLYLDGALKDTITSEIPTSGISPSCGIKKSAGTNTRFFDVDFVQATYLKD